MPELPDIENYIRALEPRVLGQTLDEIRLNSVFLVRTVDPPVHAVTGLRLTGFRRIGKRLVLEFADRDPPLFVVIHLMIAGRLHWKPPGAGFGGRRGQCAFDFTDGTLLLTEAGKKRRASLSVFRGELDLATCDPGGLEVFDIDEEAFWSAITGRNHTLKRALTDPRILSGIGGAYADEIMHEARLSPVKWTRRLTREESDNLYAACRKVLQTWTARIEEEAGEGWPTITAFRPGMAVHGKFGEPCPVCQRPVQRIVYASNETNYCAACQTGGKILADRSLSRLLKKDWPRTLEELEEFTQRAPGHTI